MTGEAYAATTRKTGRPTIPLALLTFVSGEFPSLKARQLLRILGRLGYEVSRHQGSSHRWLEAEGRPRVRFSYHDRETVPPRAVKDILVKQVDLTVDEALKAVHDD